MVAIDRKAHWENVYQTKGETGVSWYQSDPRLSLELIRSVAPSAGGRIIDVGGGASHLVDRLLDLPFDRVAVLDISDTALRMSRSRLGERAERVRWFTADVTEAPELGTFDIWHDRAVFHFLTDPADRARYLAHLHDILKVNGTLIMATFALDGPHTCSGLPVVRYSPETLAGVLGDQFTLLEARRHVHRTPWDSEQAFQYSRFVRRI